MSLDGLRTGCVIRFPYLWVREAERGETEGRKPRRVAVGVRIARPKGDDLLVLAMEILRWRGEMSPAAEDAAATTSNPARRRS